MEESYGNLVGTHARDKDAVSAAMIIAEMTAYYASQNKSLTEKRNELYEKYGYYKTALLSLAFPGKDGKAEMDEIVAELRKNPWQTICGEKVTVKDYLTGLNGLPKSNVLAFAGKNVKITVRPSGTEPKLKIYFQTKADSEQNAEILLQKLKEQAENLIKK